MICVDHFLRSVCMLAYVARAVFVGLFEVLRDA